MAKRNRGGNGTQQKGVLVPASKVPPAVVAAALSDVPAETASEVSNGDDDTITIERADYLAERKTLIDLEKAAADQHDESILKLASGALALTITFLEKIANNPSPHTAWLIRAAWIFLILSIFSMLLSFLTSQSALRRQRTILDNTVKKIRDSNTNRWSTITAWLNPISYLTFVAGISFALAFAWVNFNPGSQATEGSKMADQKQPQKPNVQSDGKGVGYDKAQGGYVPPTAPAAPSGTKKDAPAKKEK